MADIVRWVTTPSMAVVIVSGLRLMEWIGRFNSAGRVGGKITHTETVNLLIVSFLLSHSRIEDEVETMREAA